MDNSQLQELFDFDDADLAANRKCMLSDRQIQRIKQAESRNSNLVVVLGMVSILIVLVSMYDVISRTLQQYDSLSNTFQNDAIQMLVEVGIPGLVFGFIVWGPFKFGKRQTSHTVQQVYGRVNFVKTENLFPEKQPNGSMSYRTLEQYELHVGKVRFEAVNQRILSFIHNGDTCIFYYLKESREILSAEEITNEPDKSI